MISLFKMALKHSTEIQSTVPKNRKAEMCFKEKICMLDKLHTSMSYTVVGHEFKVTELALYMK